MLAHVSLCQAKAGGPEEAPSPGLSARPRLQRARPAPALPSVPSQPAAVPCSYFQPTARLLCSCCLCLTAGGSHYRPAGWQQWTCWHVPRESLAMCPVPGGCGPAPLVVRPGIFSGMQPSDGERPWALGPQPGSLEAQLCHYRQLPAGQVPHCLSLRSRSPRLLSGAGSARRPVARSEQALSGAQHIRPPRVANTGILRAGDTAMRKHTKIPLLGQTDNEHSREGGESARGLGRGRPLQPPRKLKQKLRTWGR